MDISAEGTHKQLGCSRYTFDNHVACSSRSRLVNRRDCEIDIVTLLCLVVCGTDNEAGISSRCRADIYHCVQGTSDRFHVRGCRSARTQIISIECHFWVKAFDGICSTLVLQQDGAQEAVVIFRDRLRDGIGVLRTILRHYGNEDLSILIAGDSSRSQRVTQDRLYILCREIIRLGGAVRVGVVVLRVRCREAFYLRTLHEDGGEVRIRRLDEMEIDLVLTLIFAVRSDDRHAHACVRVIQLVARRLRRLQRIV